MKHVLYLIALFFCACFAPQYVNASGDLIGTVTDSVTGQPISGALIIASKGGQRQTTNTETNGSYIITNLNQGNFTVTAGEPGYQTQVVGTRIMNNQAVRVDFALVPNGGTISGTVTDTSPIPVPISGATIEIYQGQTLITSATTDGSGAYSAPNLANE